jgi:hypothetical protein
MRLFFLVSLMFVHGFVVACCLGCVLLFVVYGVVKLFSSFPYFPLILKNQKKIGFARGRNSGVVTKLTNFNI